MILKIIFVLLCGVGGVTIGIFIKNKIDRKKNYFLDICAFCDTFRHNLTYKQSKLKDICAEFSYVGEDFKRDMENFLRTNNPQSITTTFLKNDEKNEIINFFSSLGNVDIQTQISMIDERKTILNGYYLKNKEKADKDGKLYIKLGLLFGLCVGVLLI